MSPSRRLELSLNLDCLSPERGSRGRDLGTEVHPLGFPQGSLKFQNL